MAETTEQIIRRKRAEVARAEQLVPLHELAMAALQAEDPWRRNLPAALTGPELRLIAEIRRPTAGGMSELLFDPRIIAQEFAGAGAAAISVRTDDPEVGSELHLVRRARHYMPLPVIVWDWFVDQYQVYQSWEQQADAVALAVEVVGEDELGLLMRAAGKLRVAAVVVVRDEFELESALAVQARIICVENRAMPGDADDLTRTEKLAPHVPGDALLISAHAIRTREDALRVAAAGADAALFEPPADYELARDAIRDLRHIEAPGRPHAAP
ncbi:MAG TPA: indole-3-glycerol-phosphate synthase TrpC [Armatimonadota bacterium]|nr:indole-3-glycerol-phosphate synthase TrpC [Armatimonadota bacterium]